MELWSPKGRCSISALTFTELSAPWWAVTLPGLVWSTVELYSCVVIHLVDGVVGIQTQADSVSQKTSQLLRTA